MQIWPPCSVTLVGQVNDFQDYWYSNWMFRVDRSFMFVELGMSKVWYEVGYQKCDKLTSNYWSTHML